MIPWDRAFNGEAHPFVRWFEGGKTNAAFNEVDRHVLAGHADEVAAIGFDEADSIRRLSRGELLVESAVRACELSALGLRMGDRVLIHMSNSLEQLLWIEACKRKGVILSATAIDQPASVLKARLEDLSAKMVLTHATKGAAEKVHTFIPADVQVVDTDNLQSSLAVHREKLQATDAAVQWERIAEHCPAVPLDANFPLFVAYTSGSTGAPKGIVHVHGYIAGVARTMSSVFGAIPGQDTILVVANPGWITGQSYMVTGALTSRTTTVMIEGSPVSPSPLRFAKIMVDCGATIFKAGSTVIRYLMSLSNELNVLKSYDLPSQLRVATFCAEPVNNVVHEFASRHICRRYINSYWATEHGGIVWSTLDGDDNAFVPDAHTR